MTARRFATAVVLALTATLSAAPVAPKPGVDWPQFRGISAAGIAEGYSLPATWNAATGENIVWKTPIPGLGLSSPVVWGDTVLVSTSISGKADSNLKVGLYGDITPVQDDTAHEWRVYAIDKKTGAVKWQQTAYKGVPKIKRHMKNSHANEQIAMNEMSTPVLATPAMSDGRLLLRTQDQLMAIGRK